LEGLGEPDIGEADTLPVSCIEDAQSFRTIRSWKSPKLNGRGRGLLVGAGNSGRPRMKESKPGSVKPFSRPYCNTIWMLEMYW
jgi:hypothetical protein